MESKFTADTTVSTTELACILGITGRRVRQLVEDGQLEKVGRGRFALADSLQRYIRFQSKVPLDDEDRNNDMARRRAEADIKASKAAVAEMEAQELQRKMHRAEDVAAMTEDLIYTIREAINALPDRLAVDVAAAATPAEAAEIIRKEVHVIMRELANYEYDPEQVSNSEWRQAIKRCRCQNQGGDQHDKKRRSEGHDR